MTLFWVRMDPMMKRGGPQSRDRFLSEFLGIPRRPDDVVIGCDWFRDPHGRAAGGIRADIFEGLP